MNATSAANVTMMTLTRVARALQPAKASKTMGTPTNVAIVGPLARPSEGVSGAISPIVKMTTEIAAAKPTAGRPHWRRRLSTVESMMLVVVPANV